MRIGVYIDGFNLYYGLKDQAKATFSMGWKWLDVRKLAAIKLSQWRLDSPEVDFKVKYFSAIRNDFTNPSSALDQGSYFRALEETEVQVVLGYYVFRRYSGLLTDRSGRFPENAADLASQEIFLPSLGPEGQPALRGFFKGFEEKGSDVNLAAHLLSDAFSHEVEAAMVFSNDGDLAGALSIARTLIPVALINPKGRNLTHALRGSPEVGAGSHFWSNLSIGEASRSQFDSVKTNKPELW